MIRGDLNMKGVPVVKGRVLYVNQVCFLLEKYNFYCCTYCVVWWPAYGPDVSRWLFPVQVNVIYWCSGPRSVPNQSNFILKSTGKCMWSRLYKNYKKKCVIVFLIMKVPTDRVFSIIKKIAKNMCSRDVKLPEN